MKTSHRVIVVLSCSIVGFLASTSSHSEPFGTDILLHGTVVTMNPARAILKDGHVLVRSGKIVAVWQGNSPPSRIQIGGTVSIDPGSETLIFPGLINLHDHPSFDVLHLWPTPSSHVQPDSGRPNGTEPYGNRYQWNQDPYSPEYARLVDGPYSRLTNGLFAQALEYAEVRAVLGGETAAQGSDDGILVRNVEGTVFGMQPRVESRTKPITDLSGSNLLDIQTKLNDAALDAWIVHLAEGVRDNQRRVGDNTSSRSELVILDSKKLLTDRTVIVHGNGLDPEDFATMRAARSAGGLGDGLGAKLVWSPLSNLLLYGQTALVYHALEQGVVVSLGTDWGPSGSRNLLDELKIADITLRDPKLLGSNRNRIPEFSIEGKSRDNILKAEAALDRMLVEMVTTNPAKAIRWSDKVGSVEPGKMADLLVITGPPKPPGDDLPQTPYRKLINATERDVQLVLVNGEPVAGDVAIMQKLKPNDCDVVSCNRGGYAKAVDLTAPKTSTGQELSKIEEDLRQALRGKNLPANERVELAPVMIEDDDFYFALLERDLTVAGLIADSTPPFVLYPANSNHIQGSWNPFAADRYRNRYYWRHGIQQSVILNKKAVEALPTRQPIPNPGPIRLATPTKADSSR